MWNVTLELLTSGPAARSRGALRWPETRTDSHGKTKWRVMWGRPGLGNGRKLLQLFTGWHNIITCSAPLSASHQTIKLHSFQRNLLNCKLSRISHHIITAPQSQWGGEIVKSFFHIKYLLTGLGKCMEKPNMYLNMCVGRRGTNPGCMQRE